MIILQRQQRAPWVRTNLQVSGRRGCRRQWFPPLLGICFCYWSIKIAQTTIFWVFEKFYTINNYFIPHLNPEIGKLFCVFTYFHVCIVMMSIHSSVHLPILLLVLFNHRTDSNSNLVNGSLRLEDSTTLVSSQNPPSRLGHKYHYFITLMLLSSILPLRSFFFFCQIIPFSQNAWCTLFSYALRHVSIHMCKNAKSREFKLISDFNLPRQIALNCQHGQIFRYGRF